MAPLIPSSNDGNISRKKCRMWSPVTSAIRTLCAINMFELHKKRILRPTKNYQQLASIPDLLRPKVCDLNSLVSRVSSINLKSQSLCHHLLDRVFQESKNIQRNQILYVCCTVTFRYQIFYGDNSFISCFPKLCVYINSKAIIFMNIVNCLFGYLFSKLDCN